MKLIIVIFIAGIIFFACGIGESKIENSSISSDSSSFDYDSTVNELKNVLSEDFIVKGHSCFVIASNLSEKKTDDLIANTIESAEKCFYNNFFEIKPDELVTIFLFNDDESYRYWAKKLFDDDDLSRFGYYKPSKKTMLMNINTGSGTLVHEMTHAFVRYDFPDIPSWFNEGLGSLYERCSLSNGEILGYVNWRLPDLQDAIYEGSYTSIKSLTETDYDEFYGDRSGFNYAQARYLCYYLQEKKLLKPFYKMFRERYSEDNTGGKFLEEVTGKTLSELDKTFIEFAKKLRQ